MKQPRPIISNENFDLLWMLLICYGGYFLIFAGIVMSVLFGKCAK